MDNLERLVASLERDKSRLLDKVQELRNEIKSIDTVLMRIKAEKHATESNEIITRKNVERVYNEQVIMDVIKSSKTGLTTSGIKTATDKAGYNINYNTLRSYVSRMRDKGSIYRKPGKYRWLVAESKENDLDF